MTPAREIPLVLTIPEVAAMLRLSVHTVGAMARDGRLPKLAGIRHVRIPRSAVLAYLEGYDAPSGKPDRKAPAQAAPPRRGKRLQADGPLALAPVGGGGAVVGREYNVYGYKGKQVRDQIHSHDVGQLFLNFFRKPYMGEVFNLGGGRNNSLSILETVDRLAEFGLNLKFKYLDQNRIGDHICYISDLAKIHKFFPDWSITYDLNRIMSEMIERRMKTHR
jgi:excisionase family DNA binding protein